MSASDQSKQAPLAGSKGIRNVSQMLNSINSTMARMGIQQKVQLQRQGEDRSVYHNVKDEEIKQLDYNAKLKRISAEVLSGLDFEGKREWALAKKREGNAAYRSEDIDGAIEKYMEAIMAIDHGNTEEQKEKMTSQIQIPVLTNLAACFVEKEQWARAEAICDEAAKISSKNTRILLRRARARIGLGGSKLSAARSDLRKVDELLSELPEEEFKKMKPEYLRHRRLLRAGEVKFLAEKKKEKKIAKAMVASMGKKSKDSITNAAEKVEGEEVADGHPGKVEEGDGEEGWQDFLVVRATSAFFIMIWYILVSLFTCKLDRVANLCRRMYVAVKYGGGSRSD